MRQIPLTKGKFALVSDEDYERVSAFKWNASWSGSKWYACRQYVKDGKLISIKMHRFIVGAVNGVVVDHKNRDGLDNQRKNLRQCTQSQNLANSVGHKDKKSGLPKCVEYGKSKKNFFVVICQDYKKHRFGPFDTVGEAEAFQKVKSIEMFGEFAIASQ